MSAARKRPTPVVIRPKPMAVFVALACWWIGNEWRAARGMPPLPYLEI